MQLREFVWTFLCVYDVFGHFLLIDATETLVERSLSNSIWYQPIPSFIFREHSLWDLSIINLKIYENICLFFFKLSLFHEIIIIVKKIINNHMELILPEIVEYLIPYHTTYVSSCYELDTGILRSSSPVICLYVNTELTKCCKWTFFLLT